MGSSRANPSGSARDENAPAIKFLRIDLEFICSHQCISNHSILGIPIVKAAECAAACVLLLLYRGPTARCLDYHGGSACRNLAHQSSFLPVY